MTSRRQETAHEDMGSAGTSTKQPAKLLDRVSLLNISLLGRHD